jgi:formylglycine-generating enzyme required for sulfatase activity
MIDAETLLRSGAAGQRGEAADFVVAADQFLSRGQVELAASALDRAFGLAPEDPTIIAQRRDVLDRLAVTEHGLVFRYVPAGTFLMGSTDGDPDERPVHAVALPHFWIADRPITWAEFCDVMHWEPPPIGQPREADEDEPPEERRMDAFHLREANKIRRGYCSGAEEEEPPPRRPWLSGDDDDDDPSWHDEQPEQDPPPARPREYDCKPMVAVGWADAEELAERMSSAGVRYALPNEAQWEKAARGGLIGARYSWGDEPPTPERSDFGHFGRFSIGNPRSFPANGYGVHGMCGGVWEWTSTLYDALAYANKVAGLITDAQLERRPDEKLIALNDYQRRASRDPMLHETPLLRVLRGGWWADGARAIPVSVRTARAGWGWKSGHWSGSDTPNVGFRLLRR